MKLIKLNSISDYILIVSFYSILNNGLFDFGIRLYVILPILYLLYRKQFKLDVFNSIIGFELVYFIFLFIAILTLFPFSDTLSSVRSFTQGFTGRYITQFFRFVLELCVSQFYLRKYRYDSDNFCFSLYLVTLFTIIIGLLDFFVFNGMIYKIVLGETHVSGRYTSLNVEPRMFGIILVYVYSFLAINKYSNKVLLPIILAILLTSSVSSIIIFFVVFLYFNRKSKFLLLSFLSLIFSIFFFYLLPNIDQFTLLFNRLDYLINLKTGSDYYSFFSIFEVFDRAALNALFNNKVYLFSGFGPNTISIPSSYYIPDEFQSIYQGIINSVPHSGLINILSRSGAIFLILFFIKFFRTRNFIFFVVYLFQANFIFYTFYTILFYDECKKK